MGSWWSRGNVPDQEKSNYASLLWNTLCVQTSKRKFFPLCLAHITRHQALALFRWSHIRPWWCYSVGPGGDWPTDNAIQRLRSASISISIGFGGRLTCPDVRSPIKASPDILPPLTLTDLTIQRHLHYQRSLFSSLAAGIARVGTGGRADGGRAREQTDFLLLVKACFGMGHGGPGAWNTGTLEKLQEKRKIASNCTAGQSIQSTTLYLL